MAVKRWMILRNAFKTRTMFSTQGEASKSLDRLTLRYRSEEFYMVEVEYEESEKERKESERQLSLKLKDGPEGKKTNLGVQGAGCCGDPVSD